MKTFVLKYGALIGCIFFMFGNFVACGAQMYKMSLEEDVVEVQDVEGSDDPGHPNFGLHTPRGWNNLPIKFRVGEDVTPDQRAGIVRAMGTWEAAVGRKLFNFQGIHRNTIGDSFNDLYSSLDDDVNGHYFDENWMKTKKSDRVLATTIWEHAYGDYATIDKADIRFNGEHYIISDAFLAQSDGARTVVDIETLALHELGHLLGLSHIENENDDPYSIMNKAVYVGEGLTNRRLSVGDIKRVQKIYGCKGRACNIEKTLALLEQRWTKEEQEGSTVETGH